MTTGMSETLYEVSQEVAMPALKGGATTAGMFWWNYALDEVARGTGGGNPDPGWEATVPWYTPAAEHGITTMQALMGHAAHVGEVALYAAPIGGLWGVGFTLGSRANEASIDGDRVRAATLGIGSLACYAAAGAWMGGIGVLRTTPDHSYAAGHRTEVTLILAGILGAVGGAIDTVRHVAAIRRVRTNGY